MGGDLCKFRLQSGSQMLCSDTFWLIDNFSYFFFTKPVTASHLSSLQDRGLLKAAPSGWTSFLWEAPKQAVFLTKPISRKASTEDTTGEWGSTAEDLCSWKWTCCSESSDCQNCDPARAAQSHCRSVSPTFVLTKQTGNQNNVTNFKIY